VSKTTYPYVGNDNTPMLKTTQPYVENDKGSNTNSSNTNSSIDHTPKNERQPSVVDFVKSFYEYLSSRGGKKKYTAKQIDDGVDTIDKLVRIDGYDLETEIKPALRWGMSDDFWSANVMSLAPLRKKGKNGDTKFTNLFNQFYAAKHIKKTEKGNTLDEFEKMIRGIDDGNNDIGATEAKDSYGAVGTLGLPLPK